MHFRSKFEEKMAKALGQEFQYEPFSVDYEIPATYKPDFVYTYNSGCAILVECKGWFRPGDRKKYKAIRDSLPVRQELVFLLQHPNKKVSKGAQLTMAGWCEKEGIEWFSDPEELKKYAHS